MPTTRLLILLCTTTLALACGAPTDPGTDPDGGTDGTTDGGGNGGTDGGGELPVETTTITIPNADFESPALASGGVDPLPANRASYEHGFGGGTVRPTTNSMTAAEPLAAPANGSQAFAVTTSGGTARGFTWFPLDETMKYDDEYTLTVAVGRHKVAAEAGVIAIGFVGPDAWSTASNPFTVLFHSEKATGVPAGAFADYTTTFRVPAELDGLKIYPAVLVESSTDSGTFFDNVRLTRKRNNRAKPTVIIQNPSFEIPAFVGFDYVTRRVAGWRNVAVDYNAYARKSANVTPPNGANYLEGGSQYNMQTYLGAGLEANKNYQVTVKSRLHPDSNTPGTARVVVDVGSTQLIGGVTVDGAEWKDLSICFNTGPQSTLDNGIALTLTGDPAAPVRCLYDDVRLVPVESCPQ